MSQPLIMSFRPDAAAMCLDGRKTRTRRIWKPEMSKFCKVDLRKLPSGEFEYIHSNEIIAIGRPGRKAHRTLTVWSVGSSIAIKPSRTSKAVGRVMCVGLRVEHVQDITEEEARAEGVDPTPSFAPDGLGRGGELEYAPTYRAGFESVWRRLNPRGPNSWDANPLVVAIEFRPLAEKEK